MLSGPRAKGYTSRKKNLSLSYNSGRLPRAFGLKMCARYLMQHDINLPAYPAPVMYLIKCHNGTARILVFPGEISSKEI